MGKNHRHQKNLKSERAKVKLKAKKSRTLPRGQNVTNPSFKVTQIVIRDQLKSHDTDEVVSRRKLNVKDLLSRLQHHNSTVRQEAIRELKEILQDYSAEQVSPHLGALLQGISSLALDKERDIRRDALKALPLLLSPLSSEQLSPFAEILVSYLRCAMTHINPTIKEDSLLLLDVLVQCCPQLVSRSARRILPDFLDLISKHQRESATSRALTTTLSARSTAVKWRARVLERLSAIFTTIVADLRLRSPRGTAEVARIVVDEGTRYLGLFARRNVETCGLEAVADEEEDFRGYARSLVPLMAQGWLEVRPQGGDEEGVLTSEAAVLLRIIASIFVNFVDVFEAARSGEDSARWFSGEFRADFVRFFVDAFPYFVARSADKGRRRQGDFQVVDGHGLLEENLNICLVYMWMIGGSSRRIGEEERENVEKIFQFISDRLRSWSSSDAAALPTLTKLLRMLYMKSSKVLYKSGISVSVTLRATISASCRQPKRELQAQLFAILGEIVLNHDLIELHSEAAFKAFVKTLPDLLLSDSIHHSTIQMLNRAVLQHGNWIRSELANKQEEILENAKKIEISGSSDVKESRLLICNLLYFVDGQVYY